jgi:NADH-dependent peroxiredoxin subunit C
MLKINQQAPEFSIDAFHENDIKKLNLTEFKGKWVILAFYPADFTFVCPTELGELADKYEELKSLNTEIISISTDTPYVHKAWHDDSPTIKKITYPMGSDTNGRMSKAYGTYIEDDGLSIRATFIIDPDGNIKAYDIHDNSIGRSADEIIRKLKAIQFVRENGNQVCPANWAPGKETITPGLDKVGKI